MGAANDTVAGARPLLAAMRARDRDAIEAHPRYVSSVIFVAMAGIAAASFANMLLVAALPTVADDLNTTVSVVAWVQIAPAIAFGVSMPLFGKLGDLYGHRRVFIWGWGIATLLAFAAAFSPNVATLVVLRTSSQLAGASTSPAAYAILASILPPEDRARAFGKVLTVMSASPVIAIVVGGPLIDIIGWRPMFVVQAAIATVAVAAAIPLLPETKRRIDVRFDIAGAIALTVGIAGLLFAINRVGEWGLDHRTVQTTAVLGVAGLAAFVMIERRVGEPLIYPSWLTRRDVGAPVLTNMSAHFALMGLNVVSPFLFKRVFGYGTGVTAILTGLRPAAFSVAAALSARHARKLGPRLVLLAGNLSLASGCVVMVVGVRQHSVVLVVISIIVTGFGSGYGRLGLILAVTNAVDDVDVGLANGVVSMAGQLGSSIGQTVLVAIIGTSAASATFANSAWAACASASVAVALGLLIIFRNPS